MHIMLESNTNYSLVVTTQGPLYPPAEVVDKNGNFIVVGQIPTSSGVIWSQAIVSKDTLLPKFGEICPYTIVQNLEGLSSEELEKIVFYTLPLPIPKNNYQMLFAPEQSPNANSVTRESLPLHEGYIFDYREIDGKRNIPPINLYTWLQAEGKLEVVISNDKKSARFNFNFKNLIPNSLYTVMSLREQDLLVTNPTRPGPLGIPNVFTTDSVGNATYWAELSNPFPEKKENSNRIINIIVLFMSSRQSYGGAIGLYGLGGDIHAHLKLPTKSFDNLITVN